MTQVEAVWNSTTHEISASRAGSSSALAPAAFYPIKEDARPIGSLTASSFTWA